jgi:SNF2 family DNA or RNA helicase
MIPKAAIEAYLSRDLDNHLWIKDLSSKELDAALDALRPRPDLWPGLRTHQRACFLLGVAYPGFGFWLDMGTGKTLLALELLRYWHQIGKLKRALVFVTSDKAFSTWEGQLDQFDIGLPCVALEGSSKDKWAQLQEFKEGIVLVTYPGAVAMASERVPVRGKSKKMKMKLSQAKISLLSNWGDGLVIDESTKVGNHTSLTYQLINRLGIYTSIRYALAGRPFGRDPTMLWSQYHIIDGGETLGETLGLFRAAFFNEKKIHWDKSGRARDYIFNAKKRPVLSDMLQHRSITYGAEECIDLPAFVPIIEPLSFSSEAETYYQRVVAKVIASKGNVREMKNAFIRMRQVSSGFVGVVDDETGEKAEIEFVENPKLDWTLELAESIPEGHKIVIFYEFTWSGRKLTEALTKLGLNPIWLWSGTKNSREELNRFETDPSCEAAVINHRVGAYSLDGLQKVANYTVFYESPVSVIDREQAERRLRRDGQLRKVFQYDPVVRGSVDRKILEFHKEGEELMTALLRDPEKVLEG